MTFGAQIAAKVMSGKYKGMVWVETAFKFLLRQSTDAEQNTFADWLTSKATADNPDKEAYLDMATALRD